MKGKWKEEEREERWERSGENVYAAESIPTIDRTDICIPLRENRRDRRVPGSTRRASGHEERTTFTEEAASTLLSFYLSLSLTLPLPPRLSFSSVSLNVSSRVR